MQAQAYALKEETVSFSYAYICFFHKCLAYSQVETGVSDKSTSARIQPIRTTLYRSPLGHEYVASVNILVHVCISQE